MAKTRPYNGFTGKERDKAYYWAIKLYENGERAWPKRCQACGQTEGKMEPHSEDYSEPYGDHIGRWSLCFNCHRAHHLRFRCPEGYLEYRKMIRQGFRLDPTVGFYGIYALLCGTALFRGSKHSRRRDDVFAKMLAEAEEVRIRRESEKPLLPRLVKKADYERRQLQKDR